MLLFGGQLSGVKNSEKEEVRKKVRVNDEIRDEEIQQTPHSEVIEKLTDHEYRLLEELERTRTKLQTEWTIKVKEMKAQGRDISSIETLPLYSEFSNQDFSISSGDLDDEEIKVLKAKIEAAKNRTSSKAAQVQQTPQQRGSKVIRNNYDILPILTNKGETPFEVGLEKTAEYPRHILPIFKLPDISPKAQFRRQEEIRQTSLRVNRKKKDVQEEEFDDDEVMKRFGLTNKDINEIKGSQEGEPIGSNTSISNGGKSPMSFLSNISPKRACNKKNKRKGIKGKKYQIISPSKLIQKEKEALKLRKELKSSIQNVQFLTRQVKRDITSVHHMCPITSIRAGNFMKKYGMEKVHAIFNQLQYSLLISALDKWKNVIAFEKRMEKQEAYNQYKGTKKLKKFLANFTQRHISRAWETWIAVVEAERVMELREKEEESALKIQTAYRAHVCREFVKVVKRKQRYLLETKAALKIQAIYRGRAVRVNVKQLVQNMKLNYMATKIQALFRGVLARNNLYQIKELQKEIIAARKVQALFRGRMGRKKAAKIKRNKQLDYAAIKIQTRYRGVLGRKAAQERRQYFKESYAVIFIQKRMRGVLGRKRVAAKRREDALYRKKLDDASRKIQALYRGHRGRLATHIKLIAHRERNKELTTAAIKIQTFYRARYARKTVIGLKFKRVDDMVKRARQWVEYWDQDYRALFYYNAETAEALWQPPEQGYTNSNGKLILMNGTIIDDPGLESAATGQTKEDVIEEDDEDVTRNQDGDILCVECEQMEASKRCNQCEDYYCDECFSSTHNTEKRQQHSWKAMGPIRCSECEKQKASRWCIDCDDPYCLGCYQIIHSKGKKANHQYRAVGSHDEDNTTYQEFIGTEDYNYIAEGIQEWESQQYNNNDYNEQDYSKESQYNIEEEKYRDDDYNTNDDEEWETHVEAESGATFYYNPRTNETKWAEFQ